MKLSKEQFDDAINEMIQRLKKVTYDNEVILSIGPTIKMPESLDEALRAHKNGADLGGIQLAIAADKPFLVATASGLINQCIKAFGLTNAPPMLKALFVHSLLGLTEEGINPDSVDISELTDILKKQNPS